MYYSVLGPVLLVCLSLTSAHPHIVSERLLHITPFDPKEQHVSNTGAHEYIAPAPTDSRSPCPALNVLANNGYIPRNGNVSLVQVTEALNKVYGVAPDLAAALGLLGVTFNGNGRTFTIGGWPSYITGFNAKQFKDLYNMGVLKGPKYQETICRKYAAGNEGYAANKTDPIGSGLLGPFFDNIVFRCMANKSAEYPQGYLGRETLLTFFGRTRDGHDKFTEDMYQGKIPDNWFKRNVLDEYSTAYLAADAVTLAALGGFSNPGGDNPLDKLPIAKMSYGAYTSQDMQDPMLQMCFLTQSVNFVLPAIAARSSVLGALEKRLIATAVQDFASGIKPLPCQGHSLKNLNLELVGQLLGIKL